MWIFIKVVELGSFSKAAKATETQKSTVSKKIALLERTLQIDLLRRTTRQVHVTNEGRAFYLKCMKAFSEINFAQVTLQSSSTELTGVLRISAPVDLPQGPFSQHITSFLRRYPKVTLEMVLTDAPVDLVRENIDIVIHMGKLEDSSLMVRKIGVHCFYIVASPEYLKTHPVIRKPEDVAKHDCLVFSMLDQMDIWTLRSGKSRKRIQAKARYYASSIMALRSAAISGAGLAFLPVIACKDQIASNELAVVLPAWSSEERGAYFLYRKPYFPSPKVDAFIDFMMQPMRDLLVL